MSEAAPPGISLEKASMLALLLETLLLGVFTVLFGASVWQISRKNQHGAQKPMLATVTVMWFLAVVHWIIDTIRAFDAFVDVQDGSALAYYGDLSNPLEAAKTAVFVTLTLVGDGFIIYRCYAVWGRKWPVVVFPALLWAGTAVGGYGATVAFSNARPGEAIFVANIVPWVTSFICMTLTTNVVCTFLIAGRIMAIQRALNGHMAKQGRAMAAVAVVVESAAVYSASVIALITTYLLGSNAQYTVLDLTSPLIGITFSAIIIRVSMGLTSQQAASSHHTNSSMTGNTQYPLRRMPVAVNVSHLVERDDGSDNAKDADFLQFDHKHQAV